MLFEHYSGGMGIDTLHFDKVRADDPSVSSPEYVDVSPSALPNIQSSSPDYWWNILPPFGESILGIFRIFSLISIDFLVNLKVPSSLPSTIVRSDAVGGSSSKQAHTIQKVTLVVSRPEDAPPAPNAAGSTNREYMLN